MGRSSEPTVLGRATSSHARSDLWLVLGFVVVLYSLSAKFNIFETVLMFVGHHEEYQLDEVLSTSLLASLALAFYAARRWREGTVQIKRRQAAEQELESLNLSLEERVTIRTQSLEDALGHLREAQERYELVAQGSNDGLWDWDLRTGQVYYSLVWKAMLGLSEVASAPDLAFWLDRVHPIDRLDLKNLLDEQCRAGGALVKEFRILHSDGTYRWVQIRSAAATNESCAVTRIAGVQRDITEHKAIDPLTGLSSRLHFAERLAQAFETVGPGPQSAFAVMFLDLDRFKEVNDTLGHLAGDQLLFTIGERVRRVVRSSDTVASIAAGSLVARFGGDEFALFLAEMAVREDARGIGQRIVDAVAEPVEIEGRRVFPSVSVGIALYAEDYQNPDDMIRDADIAMYVAKSSGRGKVEVFSHEMRERILDEMEIETDLRSALSKGELYIEYQPEFDLINRCLSGFEALVRWEHPQRGLIPPLRFIPVAEATGLIGEIGAWVLRESCRQAAEWNAHLSGRKSVSVSVNVSPRQLESEGFVDLVKDCLQQSKLPPHCLHLEITESAIIKDSLEVNKVLNSMRALGVKLEIDDFGTGYSSLDHLRRFRFDVLKIDRRFIQNLKVEANREIVTSLVRLSQRMGMKVVAEGLETDSDLQQLCDIGCDMAQGFFFDGPLSGTAAMEVIDQREVNQGFSHSNTMPSNANVIDERSDSVASRF